MPKQSTYPPITVPPQPSDTLTGTFGGLTRTVPYNLLTNLVSVKSYGAVGDGSTSDSAAINAASAAASLINGAVFFPPSIAGYGISTLLDVYNNMTFCTLGLGTVKLVKLGGTTGGNACIFRVAKSVLETYLTNVTIDGFILDGTSQGASGNLIHMQGVNNLTLRNISIVQPNAFGIVVGSNGGAEPYIEGLTVENIFYTASSSSNNSDGIGGGGIRKAKFSNINIYKNDRQGSGMDLTNLDRANFSDINIEFAAPHADNWGFASDFGASKVKLQRINIKNAGQYGFYFGSTSSGVASDINIDHCLSDTSQINGVSIDAVSGYEATNINVTNSTIKAWAGSGAAQGISFKHVNDANALSNKFYNPQTANQSPVKFDTCTTGRAELNTIIGSTGLVLTPGSTNVTPTNNLYG